MATESGYSNQKKLGQSQFKTIHNVGSDQFAAPVVQKTLFDITPTPQTIISVTDIIGENGQISAWQIEITAHGAIKGNVLQMSTGTLKSWEYEIVSIVDADNFLILPISDTKPIAAETAKVMAWITTRSNEDGSAIVVVDPAPIAILVEGVATEIQDSATPSNVQAMPVKIMAVDGTNINITAGDINIQTTDMGATFDSMRIGDGSGNYIGVTVNDEAKVSDADALAELQALSSVDFATQTTLAALLTELQLKADLTETQPVSLASIPLATGAATEAKQDTGNTSLGSIDTKLSSQATAAKQDDIINELDAIQASVDSIDVKLPATLGTKTAANSLAVTLASDQVAIPNAVIAGTVTNAQATVGTSAVRATVSGSAPNAARKRLSIKPSKNNTGSIYYGSSSVTTANGLEIIGPDRLDFTFDASDYYLISDTAAQVVEIVEVI
jgi:hypothetical protein